MTRETLRRGLACAASCALLGALARAGAARAERGESARQTPPSVVRSLWRSGSPVARAAGVAAVGAQAQGDGPVEQVRKNIQVIKGLPASQLFPVMNFVAASLGVKCDYCHVRRAGDDDWLWESDEKREKQTARRMMRMVLDLNNANGADFRGNAVTCYTCHRGQTKPVGLPPLPLAVSGHGPDEGAPAAGARPPESLPTAAQVVARYGEAVGGREAVAKLRSRVMRGTREASQGRAWPVEVTIKAPDKFIVVARPPQGTVRQALDGASGWLAGPQGARAMTPAEFEQVRASTKIYELLQVGEAAPGMRVAGRESSGGRDAFVVVWEPAGGVTERLYFDSQTGLLLRRLTVTGTVLLPIPRQVDFEDYREVDGIKVPFTTRISEIDTYFSSTRRLTEVRHNTPVEDEKFKMPAATATPDPK